MASTATRSAALNERAWPRPRSPASTRAVCSPAGSAWPTSLTRKRAAAAGEAARPASWSSAPRGSLVATLKTGRQRVSTTVDGRIGIVNPGQHRRVKSRGNTHPKTAPIASARQARQRLRPPVVRAAAPGAGAGSCACARRPITPLMHYSPRPRPALPPERSFTNMTQKMPAVHPPNLKAHQGFVG